jgi:hypothetical protein
MKLSVIRKYWSKFHKFLKLLSNLLKSSKFKTTFASLNFNSYSKLNLGNFQ